MGSFNGGLSSLPAHELGRVAIEAAVQRAGIDVKDVDEVILGQVLTAGQGQNPARQASLAAGIPIEAPSWSINQVCGSGLRSVAIAMQQIEGGDANIVIAGGQESMSRSTHCQYLRSGVKMGDYQMIDTMIRDGLWDAMNGYHMGQTAENVAEKFQISREEQDKFAVASQNKAEAAQKAGRFRDEIVPVTVPGRRGDTVVQEDEYIRHGANIEDAAKLGPAFTKNGTVTAANASGINDGAAAFVVMSADEANRRGIEPLARIASRATAGVDPTIMGTGPIPASKKALARAGWSAADLDLVEANEAFAASQRQWRCNCHRSPDWRVRRTRPDDTSVCNAATRRQKRSCHALYRRRHGCRDVF